MKTVVKWLAATAATVVLTAGSAQAAPMLSIVLDGDSVTGTTPPSNNVRPGENGYYGANLFLTEAATVTFEFLGFEAGFNDYFDYAGVQQFHNQTTVAGTSFAVIVPGAQYLDFSFRVTETAGSVFNCGGTCASAGTNADPGNLAVYPTGTELTPPNFFLAIVPNTGAFETLGTVAYIMLDDRGAGVDDNHDDLVVKVTISQIPEPGSMMLLGSGLFGLAGVVRRRLRG